MKFNSHSTKRNSLLELFKFIFACAIIIFHGFTPILFKENGFLSKNYWAALTGMGVNFFFCIYGWFLNKKIKKHSELHKNLGFWKSWWKLFLNDIFRYISWLIPGIIASIIAFFYDGYMQHGIIGMYYFVHEMLLVTFVYYIVYWKFDDDYHILLASMVMLLIGLTMKNVLSLVNIDGIDAIKELWRSLFWISLGLILSKIPKLNFNREWKTILLGCSILIIAFTLIFIPFGISWKDPISYISLPLLIYGCLSVNWSFQPFNYLGVLSRELYLWQMIPYMINSVGLYYSIPLMTNKWLLFGIVVGLPIISNLVKRIIKIICMQKKLNFYTNFEEKRIKTYSNKNFLILYLILAIALVSTSVILCFYGLFLGKFRDFGWFIRRNNKLSFGACAAITLAWLSLIPILLSINWKIQHKNLRH